MRNLKRVLSLALALVMILGMMVMGAGAASADFSDAAEIDYTEAVDVVSGLGVMIGSDDNGDGVYEFEADDNLTRAETAKIMCYILMGGANAEKLPKNEAVFKDVAAGSWAAGFISYCNNLEIMVGDGKGNFDPNGQLTGVQFAKMLLVAAGYDPNAQGYAYDKNWAANIGKDAIANGLDLTGVALADAVTREQAAQMILQALYMGLVDYTTIYDYATGTDKVVGPSPVYNNGRVDNEFYGYGDRVLFMDKYFPGLVETGGVDDVFNRPAVKGWEYNGKVIYNELAKPVATYTTKITQCELSSAAKKDGTWTALISKNGSNFAANSIVATAVASAVNGTEQGVLTEVYKIGSTIKVIEISTWLAQVTDVKEATYDAAGHEKTPAQTDFDVFGGSDIADYETAAYAKDSYVLLTWSAKAANGLVDIIPTTPVDTAKLTAYSVAAGMTPATTTVGTTTYANAENFALNTPTVSNIGKTYNVFVDLYGNVIGLAVPKAADTVYNYGIMTDIAWQGSWGLADEQILANVIAMNGAVAPNVTIANEWSNALYNEGTFTAVNNASVGYNKAQNTAFYQHLYQFVINDKGAYEVTAVGQHLSKVNITTASPYIASTEGWVGNIVANDNTVYLVKTLENGKAVYTSYVGYKTVPSMIGASACFFANAKQSYVDYIYVDATAATYPSTSTNSLIVITDTNVDAVNADAKYGYYVWNGTTAELKYVASGELSAVTGFVDTNAVYQATYNANGEITGLKKLLWTAADAPLNTTKLVATYCDGTVIRNDTTSAAVAYNCTGMAIYVIDSASGTVSAGAIKDVASDAGVTNYMILDQANVVVATYVVK